MSTSSYGREQHQQFLHGTLGADLWLTKSGTPRPRMNDQHVAAAINDGNHAPAQQVMEALFRFLPMSTRTVTYPWDLCDCGYAHYGLVGPDSDHISYRTTTYVEGKYRAEPIARRHLLNHAFMVESILPSFRYEAMFDSLLIDVDVDLWGDSIDLFVLPPDEIAEIVAPWHSTLTRMGIPARFMLSGFRGFWIQVMMAEPIYRYQAEHLYHTICQEAGARFRGGAYRLPGDYIGYVAESGCLSDHVCRLPWSLREDNGNVSVHVDPQTGEADPAGLLFWEEWDPSAILSLSYDYCGCVCQPEVEFWREVDPSVLVDAPIQSRPPDDYCGCVCQPDPTPAAPPHLDWDWSDVEDEAHGGGSIGITSRWQDAIILVPDGTKREMLVGGGNIALTSARMKYELGHVDWELLVAEYENVYAGADQRKGGTIRKWIGDWRRKTHDGSDIVPCPPSLTPDDLRRCREYTDAIVASVTGRSRRPSADDIYHVLLVLCRIGRSGGGFEADIDFLARKGGINPYRTREAQMAAEGVEEVEGDRIHSVRRNRTSKNARDRLLRVMAYVCDLDPNVVTGKHPFRRTKIGTNDRSDPRVRARDKPVGSEFERVEGHPFWTGPGASSST